jgi:hypothetical protein
MTSLLEDVFDEVSKLPPEEQDALANWLREELSAGREWSERFDRSHEALAKLAEEAREEHRRGETRDLET